MVWIYTLSSVFIVSLISLVGIFAFFVKEKIIEKSLIYLVSLAAGTLLGGAFLHLIPEAFEEQFALTPLLILMGIVAFFILEKFIHWNHCHSVDCEKHMVKKNKSFSYTILAGDSLHNFVDGMIIAASYMVSIPLGIATTIAVIFHEIPQELGDFGTLVYAGFSKIKALIFNFLTASVAFAGAIIVLFIGDGIEITKYLIPFTAGGFIYVAVADLIPELHKTSRVKQSAGQFVFLLIGLALMGLLLYIE